MKKNNFLNLLLCIAVVIITITGLKAEFVLAANSKIQNLKEKKTYKIDLDKDGTKDSIYFKLVRGKTYEEDYLVSLKVKINGKTKTLKNDLYDVYEAHMQVTDIDTTDGYMDIWVYTIGMSDDIYYSALYQYQNGKIKCLYEMDYTEEDESKIVCGVLHKAKGDGTFYIKADRKFFVDTLIGNHYDLIPMKLKNGKASVKKTNTYSIAGILNEDNKLTVAVETDFYKTAGSSKIGFTAKRWDKVKPVSIYRSGEKLYVKFKSEKGEIGWLCASEFGFDEAPFLDCIWVG